MSDMGRPGEGGGTSGGNSGGKMCVRCGVDCAQLPRVKDAKGRYTCKACYDQLSAGRGGESSAARASSRAVSERNDGGGGGAVAEATPADNPLFSSGDAYDVAEAAPMPQITCPKCGKGRPPSMIACPGCGFNPFSEKAPAEPKAKKSKAKGPMKGLACASCGYDMKGLKSLKCPECGHQNRMSTKPDFYNEVSRDVARAAYMKPAIIGGVSALIIAGCSLHLGGPVLLLAMSILLFFGYAVFWVVTQLCSYLWMGLDADLKLFSVQLFAAHAGANAVTIGLATAVGGFNVMGGMAGGALMVVMLMTMVEMEKWDAIIVVVINRILMVALQIGLMVLFGL